MLLPSFLCVPSCPLRSELIRDRRPEQESTGWHLCLGFYVFSTRCDNKKSKSSNIRGLIMDTPLETQDASVI